MIHFSRSIWRPYREQGLLLDRNGAPLTFKKYTGGYGVAVHVPGFATAWHPTVEAAQIWANRAFKSIVKPDANGNVAAGPINA